MKRITVDIESCTAQELAENLLVIIRENFSGRAPTLTYPRGSLSGMLEQEIAPAWARQTNPARPMTPRRLKTLKLPDATTNKFEEAMSLLMEQKIIQTNPFQKSEDAFILIPDSGDKKVEKGSNKEEIEDFMALEEGAYKEIRKVVVFTDIENFTKYRAFHGDRASYDMLMFHDKLLMKHFGKYQGDLVKTIGDSLMVVFDSEKDAVLASVAIQRDIAKYNKRFPENPMPLVRIVIDSGIVDLLMRNGAPDYLGQVVDRASRISAHARGGEIVVSAVVCDASKGRFGEKGQKVTFEDKGRPELKGLGSVQIYKIVDGE